MTIERFERINAYDFQRVDVEDLVADQQFHLLTGAAGIDAIGGSGVLLEFAQEKVVFDSDDQTAFQQGLVAIGAFDGQGIFQTPYLVTDQVGGSQVTVRVTDARLSGFPDMKVVLLGKSFDDTLMYEVITIGDNMVELSQNHFKEITNILFQNFLGNANTSVDGYGSINVGGRVQIAEASGFYIGRDSIVAEQSAEPNMDFKFFKTSNSSISLSTTLQNALGTANNVDDLNINTTSAKSRTFAAGGSTTTIYGQKFKMKGSNIQKVSLLMSLSSGTTFSGTLVLSLRKLQTSLTSTSDFLPDDNIGFDPDIESLDEVTLDQADLADRGIVLGTTPQIVDFLFTESTLSNPTLSNLINDEYYVVTIRRTGSTTTGTIVFDEALNSDPDLRLTVFENSVWTDVEESALWFKIYGNAIRASSGIAYDNGIRIAAPKTVLDSAGSIVQSVMDNIDLVDCAEDAENYIILQHTDEFSHQEPHPRTGDPQFARKSDAPLLSALTQTDALALIAEQRNTIVLARVRDRNSKNNPTITGSLTLPALALDNVINVINPGSDLLTQNVVGSTITPNLNKPAIKYRITSQTIVTDLYGDLNGDGIIDAVDLARMVELDGYSTDLSGNTVSDAAQLAAVLDGITSVAELLRADVTGDGDIIEADDGTFLSLYITQGQALPAGTSFTRVVLTVEEILDAARSYDASANSIIQLHVADPDLIDNASFSTIAFQIDFVPTWRPEAVEITDLRRYITTTFLDTPTLTTTPESGGKNNLFIAGDMYLSGTVKELDGTTHPLDFEKNIIEIELPAGTTTGDFNIFTNYVAGTMRFSDGTLVSSTALNSNQVKFELSVSSLARLQQWGPVYDDGYYTADELIGTYIDHSTGLLRLDCRNIVYHDTLPQIRTRIQVTVSLKKAGFSTTLVSINPDKLTSLLI